MALRGSWLRRTAVRLRSAALRPLIEQSETDLAATRSAIASLNVPIARAAGSLQEAEFRAHSQFGEDGAIQWLLSRVPVAETAFVELGVESYEEANTRFLLEHDNWRGLIVDAGEAHGRTLMRTGLAWRHTIDARSAFVTAENVDALLRDQPADLGLLSIDLDGVDYWILSALTAVRPRIVIVEYNSLFGPEAAVSVPYRPDFDRRRAHYSMLYFGASISAFAHWGSTHGYRLVGSTTAGVNAFLVREDVAGDLPALSGREAWVETRVRQARDQRGVLTHRSGLAAQRALIAALPLVDVTSGAYLTVKDLG